MWGELCYRRLALFELPLGCDLPSGKPQVELEVSPLADPDRPPGHLGFVARSSGEDVAACWVARGELWSDYLELAIPLAPDESLTYETFTAPSARGQGIGPALRAEVARVMRERGDRRLLATVYLENAAALRLVEKLGYRRIGTLGWYGVGRWRRGFCRVRAGADPPGAA